MTMPPPAPIPTLAPQKRRRWWLALLIVIPLCLCGVPASVLSVIWVRADINTVGKVDFENRLAIPPLAAARTDAKGRRVFDLRAQAGTHDFGSGRTAKTWGFNGAYLGPTLRAKQGEQVQINVANGLDRTTSVHWHGARLPAKADGGPHQPIAPGATWSPAWTIEQQAATLWYHPHPHGETADQVYRGMAGMFIVDDDEAPAGLPKEYGVDDIPIVVQDKKFRGDELNDSPRIFQSVGVLGDTIAVNGTVGPYLDVTTERVRLRLLNGSTARVFQFEFDDRREFSLIGTDGGLLAAPHRTEKIMLAPGERAEIVVAVQPGERTVLRSQPPDLGLNPIFARFSGGADQFDVLQLRAASTLAPRSDPPATLADVPRLDPTTAVARRSFQLSGNDINNKALDMSRVDAAPVKDTVEVWQVVNQDAQLHDFHVHGIDFQIASINGRPPPPELAGWKDTIYLRPSTKYDIIAKFPTHVDPSTPYMIHCHILFHEDSGMMAQYVVVEPGQQPGPIHVHR